MSVDEQARSGRLHQYDRAIASLQACDIYNFEIVPKIKCGPIREKENSVPDLATEQRYGTSMARKVPFYYLKSLQGFQSKLASRTKWTSILHINFLLKSILKPNCQRSGYVFGMKKEKQSGFAPDDVSESEGQWKKTHSMEYFFLSLSMSWSDNWQLWSSTNSKSCNAKIENRVLKKISYVHNHDN